MKNEKKKFIYKNIKNNKKVEDFMAEEYALQELGITIIPKGPNGTMTLEQLENIEQTVEWFFSANWIKEEVKEDEEGNNLELINEECELEDV